MSPPSQEALACDYSKQMREDSFQADDKFQQLLEAAHGEGARYPDVPAVLVMRGR